MTHRPGRGVIAAAFAVAALALGCVAASSGAGCRRRARRGADPRPGRQLRRAGLRRGRAGRDEAAVRRRAAGDDPGGPRRASSEARLPRHQRPRPRRRRAGAALGRLRPRLRAHAALLRLLRQQGRQHRGRRVQREPQLATRADARLAPHGDRGPAPAVRRTTTAASCSSAATAASTSAPATAARRATRTTTLRTPSMLLGKLLRIDPRKHSGGYYGPASRTRSSARAGRDEIYALGLRNPYRFSFDAAAATSTSATSARTAGRRSTTWPRRRSAAPNFGWDIFEGTHDFDGRRRAPRQLPTARCFEYSSSGSGCAVIGGYVVRDPALRALSGPLPVRRLLRRPAALASIHRTRRASDDRDRASTSPTRARSARAAAGASTSPRSTVPSSGSSQR